jgi:hypothetical protein
LLAYKQFKKVKKASNEVKSQLYNLTTIGVSVYKQFQREFVLGFIPTSVFRERYTTIKIPSNFSEQQKEQAREHWSILLANQKHDDNYFLAITAGVGALLLTLAGVMGIIGGIQNFQ